MSAFRIILVLGVFSLQVSSEKQTTKMNSTADPCWQLRFYVLHRRELFNDVECLGEKYTYGHEILKFWDECAIEPENKSLSYEDSNWKFYKCIVQKSLGNQPLTLTSYAKLMARNMSATTKSAILSILTTSQSQEEIEPTPSGDRMTTETDLASVNSKNVADLGDIQKYWDGYFDAEFQVCSSTVQSSCNKTKLDSMRTLWKSEEVCKNGNVPIGLKDDYGTFKQFINCKNSLQNNMTFTNATQIETRSDIYHWCRILPKLKMSGREDVNKLLDFELLYKKSIVPKFYSKSIQEYAFKIIRKEFSTRFSTFEESIMASKSLKEIVSYAAKEISEHLRKKGHREENLMFLTNTRILMTLVYGGEQALSSICYGGLQME